MPTFQIKGKKLVPVKEKKFNLEADLQKLTEDNLQEIFGLEFVGTEFNIHNFFIDTLAFDPETKAFVIIEYKKDSSLSVIDQGFNYLSLLLNNKADFVLEYNRKKGINLEVREVDWTQSRVIFLAHSFTPYQLGAIGFKNLPMELWEAHLFENNTVLYNQLKPAETQESIKTVMGGKAVVSRELKTFTLEDHYGKASPGTKALFDELRDRIIALDENIKEKPVKFYVGYKLNWYNFVAIHIYKDKLKIHVRKEKLESDKDKRFMKIPTSYEWGKTPLWWIDISQEKDLDYVMRVVKESYDAAPDR
jgi:predicted transport protein